MSERNNTSNHLINETSPYLLQHAHNPVDWYPWGDEALKKAKEENKMIFLSIGYSTCHWCHVMAHESFEDETIATILNENYICIKIDREERPDLDAIYMNACQMMTGSGGWPLNLWLTPEQIPIYAGTYFPPHNQMGRPGFMTILAHLKKMWLEDHDELIGKSYEIMKVLSKQSQSDPEAVDQFVTIQAIRDMADRFDQDYGGFAGAPKFPSPHLLLYLVHHNNKKPSQHQLTMLTKTLDGMYQGGIYDHVGGGFARYAVDEQWLVPHFEKMLYDNALLMRSYNYGYELTKNPLYKEVAYSILRFLLREMLSKNGGFYTALDADSEGVEGKFYVYTMEEVGAVLGDNAKTYCNAYDISEAGNFEGKNIPNRIKASADIKAIRLFEADNAALLKYREKRIRPSLDHKILTSQNGMILASLAHMYQVYGDSEVLELAKGVNTFIKENLSSDATLFGSYTDGVVREIAVLDDYAFNIEGLIELYEATMDRDYLDDAIRYTQTLNERFWDEELGGYYLTDVDGENLISRPIDAYDGAMPSGNSVMGLNLMRLSRLTDDLSYQERFDHLIKRFGKVIKNGPSYFAYLMIGLLYRQGGTKDLVIAVSDSSEKESVLKGEAYIQQSRDTLTYFTKDIRVKDKDKKAIDGRTTYYVCEDFACQKPKFDL